MSHYQGEYTIQRKAFGAPVVQYNYIYLSSYLPANLLSNVFIYNSANIVPLSYSVVGLVRQVHLHSLQSILQALSI